VARVLDWLSRNTKPVSALTDSSLARLMLDTATSRLDGTRAAPSTARRNRTILANAADYAVERKLLSANPIRVVKWIPPKTSQQVDRRSVINPRQARSLLAAVRAQKPSGERLAVFFAVMYYAALRPEEAISLTRSDVTIPDLVWNRSSQRWEEPQDDWGELHFRAPTPDAGREWTDDGSQREQRKQLKHRADDEERRVPSPPPLTKLLRVHLKTLDKNPTTRLFTGVRGGELPTITYRRAWKKAREAVLTEQEIDTPLAKRPYDLRHACVSTWLNGGVPPTQVAEWAGHSVEVLLRIYAACLSGQYDVAKRRISAALMED
jgi:integrase